MSTNKDRKILDEVSDVMRLHHYFIHTERTYIEWMRRFSQFHNMHSRNDLAGGEQKIEAFLTHLAVNLKVAPATQNLAMNALVFLYRQVMQEPLDKKNDAIRTIDFQIINVTRPEGGGCIIIRRRPITP